MIENFVINFEAVFLKAWYVVYGPLGGVFFGGEVVEERGVEDTGVYSE